MVVLPNRGWDGLPQISKYMYQNTYFLPNEDYNAWVQRIVNAYSNDTSHADRMATYMKNYWFHPSTPISSNGGLDRGFPISCFIADTDDSKKGIFNAWQESSWLGAYGGGVGRYWSNVREINAPVASHGGKSSGVIPFMCVDGSLSRAVSQGGLRRFSQADWLRIDHPEIQEFIDIRKVTGDQNRRDQDLHHGVIITDQFMWAVVHDELFHLISPKTGKVASTIYARELWHNILNTRITTGEPYIMFYDTVNKQLPSEYVQEGLDVHLSNLCVTGDTTVLTEQGNIPIEELEGVIANCWNGESWSPTRLFKTSDGQEVLKVELSNGTIIEATPYHKWYIGDNCVETTTKQLAVGDVISTYYLPDLSKVSGLHVVSIVDEGKIVPTYCGTEPIHHKLVFNGVLTGNCTEILSNTSPEKTNVCCLASLNLEYWDEYSGDINQVVADCTDFLDSVLQDFIDRSEGIDGFELARKGAIDERNLGLGVMGYHSLLQKRGIPFESALAQSLNKQVFKAIREASDAHQLTVNTPCPMAIRNGTHRRNILTMAVAPTMSISNLCNLASSGTEPWIANTFSKKLKQGTFVVENKFLRRHIIEQALALGKDDDWIAQQFTTIKRDGGSVRSLDWMDDYTKDVFKTAFELDQRWVIQHAADRTPYIDQGQSTNLFIPGNSDVQLISDLHMYAWKQGLKTLYYTRSNNAVKLDSGSSERKSIKVDDMFSDTCLGCT